MREPVPEIPLECFEVFAAGLDHPEGLAFHRDGSLWAGGEAGQVYRISPGGDVETVASVGSFCAGLAFSPAHELVICVTGAGVVRVQPSGRCEVFAGSAGGRPIAAANFPLFDSRGFLYVTDSGRWKRGDGRLLRIAPGGRAEVIAGPLGYANGLALSADERWLFMVESDKDRVLRFAIPPEGPLGPPEVYAENIGRLPDGLALDRAGNLFVCCYASDEIFRVDPARNVTLLACDRYSITLGHPTNMAFGGAGDAEMYVANLGRQTIVRARLPYRGAPLANRSAR